MSPLATTADEVEDSLSVILGTSKQNLGHTSGITLRERSGGDEAQTRHT